MQIRKIESNGLLYFILMNDNHDELTVVNYGARLVSFKANVNGRPREMVVSGQTKDDFDHGSKYFGATVGRVAGRITGGAFTLDGEDYQLRQNEGDNTLHSGGDAFEWKTFDHAETKSKNSVAVTFSYHSPDGENEFPGNVDFKVTYTLFKDSKFTIHYEATTDAPTLFNPTNHGYFNLNGTGFDISRHKLQISADKFAVLDEDNMPTGELADVTGRPFDLRQGRKLKEVFASSDPQAIMKQGFDHPFLFGAGDHVVKLTSPDQLVQLKISTDRDAVVIFTANFGEIPMFEEGNVDFHGAVAIETQNLPDAINNEGFGDTILRPETPFDSTTTYEFKIEQ